MSHPADLEGIHRRLAAIIAGLDESVAHGTHCPTRRELHVLHAAFDHVLLDIATVLDMPSLLACNAADVPLKGDLLPASLKTAILEALPTKGAAFVPAIRTCCDKLEHFSAMARSTNEAATKDCECLADEELSPESPAMASLRGIDKYQTWGNYLDLHPPPMRRRQLVSVFSLLMFVAIPFWCCLSLWLTFSCPWTIPRTLMWGYWVVIVTKMDVKHPIRANLSFARSSWLKWYRDYFPIRLVVTPSATAAFTRNAEVAIASARTKSKCPQARRYIFGVHPHGVHSFSALVNFGTDANDVRERIPKVAIHLQTLSVQFWVPFWREIAKLLGLGDASRDTILRTLRLEPDADGTVHAVALVVGGAQEALLASPHVNDLVLTKRKGFVKLALCAGADVVPTYSFGENNLYGNLTADGAHPALARVLKIAQRYCGFAMPLVQGRGLVNLKFGVMPHRRTVVTVVGAPLSLATIFPEIPDVSSGINDPTPEQIERLHAAYVQALKMLYDEHHPVFAAHETRPLNCT